MGRSLSIETLDAGDVLQRCTTCFAGCAGGGEVDCFSSSHMSRRHQMVGRDRRLGSRDDSCPAYHHPSYPASTPLSILFCSCLWMMKCSPLLRYLRYRGEDLHTPRGCDKTNSCWGCGWVVLWLEGRYWQWEKAAGGKRMDNGKIPHRTNS